MTSVVFPNEYYWIKIDKEIVLVGLFQLSYGFENWAICGSEEIISTDRVEILGHVERAYSND